jgi:hypothetical protein
VNLNLLQPIGSAAGAVSGFAKRKWSEFFLEIDEKTEFPEGTNQLVSELTTNDEALAAEILGEAEAIYEQMAARVEGAERRATTLQGAAAIAAGLTLTGAGLLVDNKVVGTGWQLTFGLILVFLTCSLVLCAYRATLASTRVFRWTRPGSREILSRSDGTIAQARTARAAELLKAVGNDARFARYKVAMMRASAEWLTRALLALVIFALAAFLYSAVGPSAPHAPPAHEVATSR